jgi:hypothetical protein
MFVTVLVVKMARCLLQCLYRFLWLEWRDVYSCVCNSSCSKNGEMSTPVFVTVLVVRMERCLLLCL